MAKATDTLPGSQLAYQEAVTIVRDQILFELESCKRLLGTDPVKVLKLLVEQEFGPESSHVA